MCCFSWVKLENNRFCSKHDGGEYFCRRETEFKPCCHDLLEPETALAQCANAFRNRRPRNHFPLNSAFSALQKGRVRLYEVYCSPLHLVLRMGRGLRGGVNL